MTICDNCIHDDVCGKEGHLDEAMIFCADAQPVKRGKWIENAGYGGWSNSEFKCPECGITEYKPTNFCPNCGAELRGIDNG